MLQRREAWEIIDYVNRLTDPSALADTSGYASYLTNAQKRQLLETADVAERLRVSVLERALAQFVAVLAGRADVRGLDLGATPTPLVQ